jgi:adenosylmethionine-8-amino-7-oxononanoate aminotransferase
LAIRTTSRGRQALNFFSGSWVVIVSSPRSNLLQMLYQQYLQFQQLLRQI